MKEPEPLSRQNEPEQKPPENTAPEHRIKPPMGTDVAFGEGDIGEESMDITVMDKNRWTGLKSVGNLGSSEEKWDHL